MKSHTFEFNSRDLVAVLAPTFLALGLMAGFIHGAHFLGWLPDPHPILDMDRTILAHQAEASRSHPETQVVLLGDSSCLMDVSARELSVQLENEVLNLGTLSYLDLDAFARILREQVQHDPGNLRTTVLLVHPEFLRRSEPIAHHVRLLEACYSGRDPAPSGWKETIRWLVGITPLEERILTRLAGIPLPDEFRRKYGFTRDLWAFMDENRGSAIDPRVFEMRPGLGNAEYRISKELREAAPAFRSVLPPGVTLIVGLTPVPREFAGVAHAERHQQLLRELQSLLGADHALTALPAVLPATSFATITHLDREANREYTSQLGIELARWLKESADD